MLGLIVSLARSVRRSARVAVQTSQALADGDFRAQATVATHDEFGAIAQAPGSSAGRYLACRAGRACGRGLPGRSPREIQQGSPTLSQRTEQQTSTLEETASAMEHLKGPGHSRLARCCRRRQRAAEVSHHAERGGESHDPGGQTMTGSPNPANRSASWR